MSKLIEVIVEIKVNDKKSYDTAVIFESGSDPAKIRERLEKMTAKAEEKIKQIASE